MLILATNILLTRWTVLGRDPSLSPQQGDPAADECGFWATRNPVLLAIPGPACQCAPGSCLSEGYGSWAGSPVAKARASSKSNQDEGVRGRRHWGQRPEAPTSITIYHAEHPPQALYDGSKSRSLRLGHRRLYGLYSRGVVLVASPSCFPHLNVWNSGSVELMLRSKKGHAAIRQGVTAISLAAIMRATGTFSTGFLRGPT